MKAAQVELLRSAVASQRAKGIDLIAGGWGVTPTVDHSYRSPLSCACALGCLVLDRSGKGDSFDNQLGTIGVYARAMKLLGMNVHSAADEMRIDAFTAGFDGYDFEERYEREWFDVGVRLRVEMKPRQTKNVAAPALVLA